MDTLQIAVSQRRAPAEAIAGLLGNEDPAALMDRALARFRCMSWDNLAKHPEIFLKGGTLEQTDRAGSCLLLVAEPCKPDLCDAFLSHSWRDDSELKWEALFNWCEEFRLEHKRAPTLWLDKMCIDQKNIQVDLKCPPYSSPVAISFSYFAVVRTRLVFGV